MMSDNNNVLTATERSELRACYRHFVAEAMTDASQLTRVRKVRSFLVERMKAGVVLERDVLGLHPIMRAIHTAEIAEREMGLKGASLEAAVLATLPLDSDSDLQSVRLSFGDDVARILHGLWRLRQLYARHASVRSDNFRNLLVSFAEDMRVILLMIANRVYVMRSIGGPQLAGEERERVASEAAYLYAPLAHKLGLYQLKSELEDLSLKYLEHDAYYHIKEKLNATKAARDAYIQRFIDPIRKMLDEAGLKYHIKGRTKSIHSIWQKMKKQRCPFEGVYDLFAIRIILEDVPPVKEKQQCWQVYSLITDRYQPNPRRLRDWLSVPKSNGYESLHITVLGPEEKWVEVQIRTERMDDVAEHGLAAHWRYKGVEAGEGGIEAWLARIRTALESGDDMQLMDQFRSELKEDEVYVFTPKGDLLEFPKGATVLDFAFHIHSDVGCQCVGGRIGGRGVSFREPLHSGDTVEILTSKSQRPTPAWLGYVVTGRAKGRIRQALGAHMAREASIAREWLERKLKNRKLPWDEGCVSQLVRKAGFKETHEFYRAITDGRLDGARLAEDYQEIYRRENNQMARAISPGADTYRLTGDADNALSGGVTTEYPEYQSAPGEELVVGQGEVTGLHYELAKCCHPVFGDPIFGFVTVGGSIKIHRETCPNAAALKSRFGYRVIKARWSGKSGGGQYAITLRVVGTDNVGVVNHITSVLNKESRIRLRSISIDATDGLFSGILTLMADSTEGVETLIRKISAVRGVKSVTRA